MQYTAPFAMIRMPNEEAYQYFQTSQTIEKQGASLHVQPFNPALNKFSFESTSSKIQTMIGSMSFSPCHLKETDRRDYTENIQNAQLEFTQSSLHKVIISKIKIIDKPANFNLINYFQRLSEAYPQAATSLFAFEHCAWIAASPELLLKRNLNQIETVSLAGTKQKESTDRFDSKEFEEQDIVTKSIFETLAPFCINQSISIQEREIAPAGPVAHLKNRIHADLESGVSTENVLRALHPTPAISGFPKQAALDFIQKNEQHNRDLYGGYWGIQNETIETYFVHIRCMQVFSDKIAFYAGGGITAGSVIDEEWEEAEQKMNTLLSLL